MPSRAKSISDNIGTRIKIYRKKASLTQKELAELLFKSESTVRMWELGKSEPDLGTIAKLSQCLNVSVEDLLGLDRNNLSDPDKVVLEAAKHFRNNPETPADPRSKLKQELIDTLDRLNDEQLQHINDYIEFLAKTKKL
jgi:transcriptional regulator with XRE-family HTH domain